MDNTKRWSSATPGLLVIQIDQSGSMLTAFAEGKTRSEFASLATNRLINDLIQRNYDGKAPKDRCYVVVIGYGDDARILTSGYLSELEASPLRIDEVKKKISDGAGGLVETAVKMPLWVDPTMTAKANLAINCAYADGRWVFFDTAWDSKQSYRNGRFEQGPTERFSRKHFDPTLAFLSYTHRLIGPLEKI